MGNCQTFLNKKDGDLEIESLDIHRKDQRNRIFEADKPFNQNNNLSEIFSNSHEKDKDLSLSFNKSRNLSNSQNDNNWLGKQSSKLELTDFDYQNKLNIDYGAPEIRSAVVLTNSDTYIGGWYIF